jgi:hydroxymethylglutaryl-CoA lyase
MDLPFIETEEQAQHFRLGPSAYVGARSPWTAPISSPARDKIFTDQGHEIDEH